MEPGDLVQLDTLDVRPLPGVILKQFTARDVVSRWDVVEVRTRATANTATDFLSTLRRPGCPFVSNQQKWDTLEAERSGVGWRFAELPEGLVVAPSPLDRSSLHLLPAL